MTVAPINPRVTYIGNGATTEFSFSFEATSEDVIAVQLVEIATLEKTLLTLDTDYSVNLNTGEVTYPLVGSPMSSSFALFIQRVELYEQATSYSAQGNFSPSSLEQALDYATLLIQQLVNIVRGGTGVLTLGSVALSELPSALTAAPALIYVWDASGGGVLCFSDGTNWRRVDTREIVS